MCPAVAYKISDNSMDYYLLINGFLKDIKCI